MTETPALPPPAPAAMADPARAVEELRWLAAAVASANDAIILKDVDGTIREWNAAAERLYGYSRAEAIGRPVFILVPSELHEQAVGILDRIRRGQHVSHHETVRVTRDGRRIDVALTVSPIANAAGEIVGASTIASDVTERKRIEAALRHSETRLKAAQRIAHLGHWELDLAHDVLNWSDEIFRIFEIDPERFGASYDAFLDAIHPDDRERVNRAYSESVRDHTQYDIVHRLRFADGRIKYVHERCETTYDETGAPLVSLGTVHDVTDAVRGEEERTAASLYARRLIEASLDPLVTISPEGKITDVNAATEKATGVPRARLVGTDFCDYFTEPERARDGYRQVLAAGEVRDFPLTLRHTSGKLIDVMYNASLYRNAAGEVQGVFAAARDVTARLRAEAVLRESESRYRTLVDTLPQKICLKDARLKWVSVNASFARDLDARPEDLVGKTDLDFFPAALAAKHRADDERVMATGRTEELDQEYIEQGELRLVHTVKTPVRDPEGEIAGVLAIFWDVTEKRQAEERLARTLADLERSNRDLEQFAYVASHDLQEPLRMVASFTQLLAERYRGRLDSDADDFIGFAVDGAARMQRLITDLLAFSRIGTRGRSFAPVDSHAALGQALANLGQAIGEACAVVTNDELPVVLGDETQLVQLFQNLVGNAVKFRRPDVPPHVHVAVRRDGAEWVFAVRDNGIGVPTDLQHRLFVVFQRLHGRDEYPGTGIGLAMCKRIVERHGGRIGIESQTGDGATFFFTLPVRVEGERR